MNKPLLSTSCCGVVRHCHRSNAPRKCPECSRTNPHWGEVER